MTSSRTSKPTLISLIGLTVVLVAMTTPPATAVDPSPPDGLDDLTFFEAGQLFDDYDFDADTPLVGCDQEASSTVEFESVGNIMQSRTTNVVGTYTETVEATIGVQNPTPDDDGSRPDRLRGTVTAFSASFTATTPDGTWTGTKTLNPGLDNSGSCYTFNADSGDSFFFEGATDFVIEEREVRAPVFYEATLTTEAGTWTENGTGLARFTEGGVSYCAEPACNDSDRMQNLILGGLFPYGGGFTESFSTPEGPQLEPVSPPPGEPTTADDCKKGGWETLTDDEGTPFRNQGNCVSWHATGGKKAEKD